MKKSFNRLMLVNAKKKKKMKLDSELIPIPHGTVDCQNEDNHFDNCKEIDLTN